MNTDVSEALAALTKAQSSFSKFYGSIHPAALEAPLDQVNSNPRHLEQLMKLKHQYNEVILCLEALKGALAGKVQEINSKAARHHEEYKAVEKQWRAVEERNQKLARKQQCCSAISRELEKMLTVQHSRTAHPLSNEEKIFFDFLAARTEKERKMEKLVWSEQEAADFVKDNSIPYPVLVAAAAPLRTNTSSLPASITGERGAYLAYTDAELNRVVELAREESEFLPGAKTGSCYVIQYKEVTNPRFKHQLQNVWGKALKVLLHKVVRADPGPHQLLLPLQLIAAVVSPAATRLESEKEQKKELNTGVSPPLLQPSIALKKQQEHEERVQALEKELADIQTSLAAVLQAVKVPAWQGWGTHTHTAEEVVEEKQLPSRVSTRLFGTYTKCTHQEEEVEEVEDKNQPHSDICSYLFSTFERLKEDMESRREEREQDSSYESKYNAATLSSPEEEEELKRESNFLQFAKAVQHMGMGGDGSDPCSRAMHLIHMAREAGKHNLFVSDSDLALHFHSSSGAETKVHQERTKVEKQLQKQKECVEELKRLDDHMKTAFKFRR